MNTQEDIFVQNNQSVTNVTSIDLSDYGLLSIQGEGAFDLLQGQLTCDLSLLTPHKSQITALCNPKGRLLNICRLFQYQNSYYLLMEKNMVERTLHLLKKYAVFYRVTLKNESQIPFFGTKHKSKIKNTHIDIDQDRDFVFGHPEKKEMVSSAIWHYQDILSGVPIIYPHTSGEFLAHPLGIHQLESAISFKKGCYTGQEIIARMQYKGNVKYSVSVARTFFPLTPNTSVMNIQDHPVGTVIDSVQYHSYFYSLISISKMAAHQPIMSHEKIITFLQDLYE